jgi:DNA processing protein
LIYSWNAKIVRKASDILEEYNIKTWNQESKSTKVIFYDKIEEDIYKNLITQSLTIDELSKILKIDISTISFKISMMEINMIVKKWLWGKYEVV